jgi:hypothetical protein
MRSSLSDPASPSTEVLARLRDDPRTRNIPRGHPECRRDPWSGDTPARAGRNDQLTQVRLLERVLLAAGYQDLTRTTVPREERYRTFQPDLILLDLPVPDLDGVAVLEQPATSASDGSWD